MTTKVKNTFIEVADGEATPEMGMRNPRRNKTEPFGSAGFLHCISSVGDDDVESDSERQANDQPSIAYTKTFDPYEGKSVGKDLSPEALGGCSPTREVHMNKGTADVDSGADADQRSDGQRRAGMTPSKNRRVAFLCGAAAPESDDDGGEGSQPAGISYTKTFDTFESPMASQQGAMQQQQAAVVPQQLQQLQQQVPQQMQQQVPQQVQQQLPQQQQQLPQQLQQHLPQQVQQQLPQQSSQGPVPVAMQMMQQSQVFTIPIPYGMPLGSSHAIQVPMGLPPGSTILVMATNMNANMTAPAPAACGALPAQVATAPLAMGASSPPGAASSSMAPAVSSAAAPVLPMMPAATSLGMATSSSSSPSASQPLAPQTVAKTLRLDGTLQVMYVVDARKLKVNDKVIISPTFELSAAHPGQYRIIINPSPIKARGGPTFKNTGGLGNVQLKCEDRSEGKIAFHVLINDGRPNSLRSEPPRGPVEHDFTDGSVCGLAKKIEEWDFNKVVDQHSKTFAVVLDILP